MSSSMDSPSTVMLNQITEFTNTERRFRRIRVALIAFFFCLTLSLVVYLILSWETTECENEDTDVFKRNSSSFQMIMVISICSVVIASVVSFVILEFTRRRAIRHLAQQHNEVLRRYYDERGSISEPRTGLSSRASMSTRSSWTGRTPPSAVLSSPSTPPPAYEELVERGELFKLPNLSLESHELKFSQD